MTARPEFWESRATPNLVLVATSVFSAICAFYVFVRILRRKRSPFVEFLLLLVPLTWMALMVGMLLHDDPAWFRSLVVRYWPELSVPHIENQFDSACDTRLAGLMASNASFVNIILSQVDGYVLSHCFGTMVAYIVFLRDPWLLLLVLTNMEFMELWWERYYAPFRECWWDHLGLDMGANAAGVFLGWAIMKALGYKRFEILTWKNLSRCGPELTMVVLTIFEEMSRFPLLFFVPHVLGIPPKHVLSVWRIFTFKFVVVSSMTFEAYMTFVKRAPRSSYTFNWVTVGGIMFLLEQFVVLKFSKGRFLDGVQTKYPLEPMLSFDSHLMLLIACTIVWVSFANWRSLRTRQASTRALSAATGIPLPEEKFTLLSLFISQPPSPAVTEALLAVDKRPKAE